MRDAMFEQLRVRQHAHRNVCDEWDDVESAPEHRLYAYALDRRSLTSSSTAPHLGAMHIR